MLRAHIRPIEPLLCDWPDCQKTARAEVFSPLKEGSHIGFAEGIYCNAHAPAGLDQFIAESEADEE